MTAWSTQPTEVFGGKNYPQVAPMLMTYLKMVRNSGNRLFD
jgi:hypothetical protein